MTGPDDDKTLEPVDTSREPVQPAKTDGLGIEAEDIEQVTANIGTGMPVDTTVNAVASEIQGVVDEDSESDESIEKKKNLLTPSGLAAMDGYFLVLDSNLQEWLGGSDKACQFLFPELFKMKNLPVEERQRLLKELLQKNHLVSPTLFRQTVLEDILRGSTDFTSYFSEVVLPGTKGETVLMRGSACRLDQFDGRNNALLIHWEPATETQKLLYKRTNKKDERESVDNEIAIAKDVETQFNKGNGMQVILDIQARKWLAVNDNTCKFMMGDHPAKTVEEMRDFMIREDGFAQMIAMGDQLEMKRDKAIKKTLDGEPTSYLLDPLQHSGGQKWVRVTATPSVKRGRFVLEQSWEDVTELVRITDALLKDFFEKDKRNPTLLVSVDGETIVERNAPAGLIVDEIEDTQGTEVVSMADFLQSAEGMQVINRVLDEMKKKLRENVDRDQAIPIPGTKWKLVSQVTIPHPSGVDVVPLKLIEEKKE